MRLCEHTKCNKRPPFNYIGEKLKYCKQHSKVNMIDIKHATCEHLRCNKRPSFNYIGQTKLKYCKEHKQEYQINNPNKKCVIKNCNHLALYNNTEKNPKDANIIN